MTPTLPIPGPEDLARISEGLRPLMVSVDSLTEDPINARKHTDTNMKAIKASLIEFGQQKPIVFTIADRIIRAGNGTYAAAKALGWKWIAANGTNLSEAQARAFGLVDNKAGESAEWHFENLSTQLRGLADAGFNLDATGFQAFEVTPLLQAGFTPAAVAGNLEETTEAGKGGGAKTLKIPAELVPAVMRVFDAIKAARRAVEPKMTDVRALECLCLLYGADRIATDASTIPAPTAEAVKLQAMPVPVSLACPCGLLLTIQPGFEGLVTCACGKTPFLVAPPARRKSGPKASV